MINLVQQYFSESASRFPGKTALACTDKISSYADTERFTNSVANHLRSAGLKRGEFVPFFMPKSISSLHSILSILKADCAYVPIDTKSPANRVRSILEASDANWMIVDAKSREIVSDLIGDDFPGLTLFVIDEFQGGDDTERVYENLSIDIAYVLFTSGSTGVPKGVMIPHKAIIDYIDWCVDEYELGPDDVVANHAPLYFDNSTFDIYTAFKAGAELHLVDDFVNAVLPSLVKWIRQRKITTFFCVPSVLSMLLHSRRLKNDSFPNVRHIICAGEVLQPNVLREWMQMYPHIQFTNMYGPTEITVDCTYHVIKDVPEPDQKVIPIGKARKNMELFVRDADGKLQQNIGARGELLVRGTSVGYGYLRDPERSSAVFIQNPANSEFSDSLYCTGDLVEIDDAGDFLFLGRADDQIKYLGYRIELGEIEAALSSVNMVNEGVIVYNHADKTEDCAIGALVSTASGGDELSLKSKLGELLPPYMVPSVIRFYVDEFPKTPNGKYDRKAIQTIVFDTE